MCDWIDNALVVQMSRTENEVYGYIHLPCRVEVNARLREERRRPAPWWRNNLAEFTGERVIPGEVDVDLLNEHMARYTFAARLARGKRVLDAGCGAGYGSAELARAAERVVGVDRAPEAIEFARANYPGDQFESFEEASCEALPHTRCQLRTGGGVRGDRASGGLARLSARGAPRARAQRPVGGLHAQQALLHRVARRGRRQPVSRA
jgi:SAM-dependent methyltransferase